MLSRAEAPENVLLPTMSVSTPARSTLSTASLDRRFAGDLLW